jgi:hypothetical protein
MKKWFASNNKGVVWLLLNDFVLACVQIEIACPRQRKYLDASRKDIEDFV